MRKKKYLRDAIFVVAFINLVWVFRILGVMAHNRVSVNSRQINVILYTLTPQFRLVHPLPYH